MRRVACEMTWLRVLPRQMRGQVGSVQKADMLLRAREGASGRVQGEMRILVVVVGVVVGEGMFFLEGGFGGGDGGLGR